MTRSGGDPGSHELEALRNRAVLKKHECQQLAEEISRLATEADELAEEFRDLYAQASESYENGDRAEAKVLSEEAREAQDQVRGAKRARE